ncbi:MAG: hypothetical protein HYS33_08575, partial [Acidobacteria bacterium]|nr:hypothetical protein [Acidobacteriota bacterium]
SDHAFLSLNRSNKGVGVLAMVEDNSGTNNMYGLLSSGIATHTAGARNAVLGASAEGYNYSTGDVSFLVGLQGFAWQQTAGATVSNMYALLAGPNLRTAGTVNNNYGLYVDNQTAGTNNWAIFTEGTALSHFGGAVNSASGFRVAGAAASTNALIGNGTNFVGGQVSSNQLATANKTVTKSIVIFEPTTSDTNKIQLYWPAAVTLQRIACSADTGTVSINFDERAEATPNTAGTNTLASALVCDTDSQVTTSFSDSGIAVDVPYNLQITATSGTPTVVRIHVKAQVN